MKKIFLILFALLPYLSNGQIITTVAGNGMEGYNGDGIPATTAKLYYPISVIFDSAGNLFIADIYNDRIREVNTAGIISTYAGTGVAGYSADGGLADTTKISYQLMTRHDVYGNLIFSDANNSRVRKVNAITSIVTTIAGNGTGAFSGDSGPATAAELDQPGPLAIDKMGNIYIGDITNKRVRKIDTAGIITTYVGTGVAGFSGDGGLADTAKLSTSQEGLACDTAGNLYIADRGNARIRRVDAITHIITTVAGTGSFTYVGSGIPAVSEGICPAGLVTDTFGNLFIADFGNQRILKMDATGTIYSIAGTGVYGYNGDGGLADTTELYQPFDVALDPCGNLYIADQGNERVRKITYPPTPITLTNTLTATTTDTICTGTVVTYNTTATASSGTLAYQWYVNGAIISATSGSYTYAPANGDSIRCVATAANACTSAATSSNSIYMVVNPVTTPTITITASPGATVCSGTSVTYTAAATAAGATPTYQWVVNGSYIGTGSSSYTYTPANEDSIRCILTSSDPCVSAATVSSNTIIMSVGSVEAPAIAISVSPGDAVCVGTGATFTASISLGGASPAYQWVVDGASIAATGSSYTYTPANGDSIRCILTSSAACAVPAITTSNTINMVVNPILTPTITVTAPVSAPVGTTVTVNAVVAGSGGSYTIHWYNHSILFSATATPTTTYTKAEGADIITATIIPSAACYDSTTAPQQTVGVNTTGIASLPIAIGTLQGSGVSVYPNPANETVNIDNVTSQTSYKILSVVGCVLQQGVLQQTNNQLSVKQLPAGLYILELNTLSPGEGRGEAKTITKFIKQ